MSGVRAEVHENLLQLRCVAEDADRRCRRPDVEPDCCRERRAKETQPLENDSAEVDALRCRSLRRPAEGEDLAHEVACVLPRSVDRLEVLPEAGVGRGLLHRGLDVSEDDRQHVVEVVRDAACQRAERLHPLALPGPQRESVAFGLVLDASDEAGDAQAVANGRHPDVDVPQLAVRPEEPILEVELMAALEGGPRFTQDVLAIVRADALLPSLVERLTLGHAPDEGGPGIHVEH